MHHDDPALPPVIITSTNRFGHDQEHPDEVLADPMELLAAWLPANDDELRPLMTLTTIGADGYPDSRSVLLSDHDERGITFHTDARTRKARELAADGRVSIVVAWVEHARQLTIAGDAVQVPAEEAAAVFRARSRYLQLLAWMNSSELAQLPRAERVARWEAFAAEHPDGELDPPPHWVGYRVRPHRLTFWRGDLEGPSNRVEYTRDASGGWTAARLPG
ncbi:pyridoxine/pyridoxamine 5'-phosphate oxidase [Agromyces mangrovi Wang et al. 2018]|uniref:pyridoxine/pyridoxamine 5'-phosphate oxidase n=1 Tax=Agromyces mangrovi TaxID=1858653 RepID=UPI0025743A15|nr:pyridoxamine 5'-phosphate oxidase family protein [Agromyces mangrovi]BDZ63814.1 pyridoxine/pyridoxamine 5'-phosphate oxidase [Agromyces mangrovi]